MIAAHNGTMNTVLGLLAKGDMNCAGAEVDANGDLFKETKAAPVNQDREPRKPNELGPGVIQTEAEKQKAEEEKRRQEEAEEAARRAEEEAAEAARKAEEEAKKKENRKKTVGKLKNFFKNLIAEPEEE
jgi:cell division protein FtsA